MLIIGSQAMQAVLEERGQKLARTPRDLDIICSTWEMVEFAADHNLGSPKKLGDYKYGISDAPEFGHIEFEVLENSKSGRLYTSYVSTYKTLKTMRVYNQDIAVAPIEVLYSIKRSHRYYPRMWSKHIQDYHTLKTCLNGYDILDAVTQLREVETAEREGKLKTPSLNMSAKQFFNDTVSNKVFIHDEIHRVMAHHDNLPMFELIRVSEDTVKSDKNKFNNLSREDQINCVLEEAYVIALERAIIPMIYNGGDLATANSAIRWALMRIGTTLCSGWFREFAVENYPDILKAVDLNYAWKFFRAVDFGKIKRVEAVSTLSPI